MKRIIVSEKGKAILDEMKKRKVEIKARLLASEPPEEIRNWMDKHTEQTAKMNGEKFDKQTFRLGLMSMWYHLYHNKLIK